MADPFSGGMAAVGIGSTILGGIFGAEGAKAKGEADAKMYEYRAGIARINATINRQNSDFALNAGEVNARKSGLSTGFTIGKQSAIQSGSSFDINSGSAKDVRSSTGEIGLEDQDTIRTEFGRKALGSRNQAVINDQEAAMDMQAASDARKAGDTNAISTLLGTAGSVASKWPAAKTAWGI